MERKRRFQTRAQYAEEKAQETKFQKVDKKLPYLIGLVTVLIVGALMFILSQDIAPNDQAKQQEQQAGDNEQQPETKQPEHSATDSENKEQDASEDETLSQSIVTPSADPIVDEVRTNKAWKAYPTEQTGKHVSTFEKGHIDYEEKLKAIFSVLDLQQENSIVLSVRNNGNAKTAIAVVTSMNKEEKYRVSIEWFEGEGWKPMQLEVLNSLE